MREGRNGLHLNSGAQDLPSLPLTAAVNKLVRACDLGPGSGLQGAEGGARGVGGGLRPLSLLSSSEGPRIPVKKEKKRKRERERDERVRKREMCKTAK